MRSDTASVDALADDIGDPVPADSKELRGVRPWIMDRDLADRLWTKSEAWTGARFAD